MGTRISLGRGFTYGASGLRYGRSIPGVPRGYASVGKSGTLITGGPLRHWEPSRRTPSGAARCQGTTQAGDQCANSATLGTVCRRHEGQAGEALAADPDFGRTQWGAGAIFLLVVMLALIIGFFSLMASATDSYCANNPRHEGMENVCAGK